MNDSRKGEGLWAKGEHTLPKALFGAGGGTLFLPVLQQAFVSIICRKIFFML
ncbi:hypothetical protein HMPREF1985_01543 [Mitsuokella sp. oral taxon 131 str. W9106]|nr:hypothetical protein HMPREF1985_01543 [Mitsuokella sp. oral taxon 131 str. W9106]